MSPRRRAMFTVLATIAAVLVAALTVRVIAGHRSRGLPDQARPGTVLLVPGYGGGTGALDQLAGALRRAGRTVTVLALPGDGSGDLRRQADTLDDAVDAALRTVSSVDLVGYSAGGVVVRLWVQDHDGVHKARRVVTLGSPHHGAAIAAAGGAALPEACPLACQQLAPGSSLLAGLHSPVPQPPLWMSVWTEQDQTVTPPESARLDGALDVPIQQFCPNRGVSHGQLPTDEYVQDLVVTALGADPLEQPQPC
ncbi:alpha/beta fold hydrolase [Dactylosporangium sp. NPDC049525]|uniref:esterase/lipase family protein n=1 Tax=Dactylosporangium sp. NPDC049525 TaxID=3154730 RepID=UPI00343E6217